MSEILGSLVDVISKNVDGSSQLSTGLRLTTEFGTVCKRRHLWGKLGNSHPLGRT